MDSLINKEFPLPPQFMEVFYAGVAYKIALSMHEPNTINICAQRYMQAKQQAKMDGYDIPQNLHSTLEYKKGFF